MDGRKRNKGTKNNKGGNPGYGKSLLFKDKVDKFSPLFWQRLTAFIKSKDKSDVKFAMHEFNLIQTKMIPQDLTTGGMPFKQTSTDELKVQLAETLANLLK